VSPRVLIMYLGQFVEEAPAIDVSVTPEHPYTMALIASPPDPAAYSGAER
jgi:ABC-type dipeptide/oligopeptide/nickel transport system ATPase component